LITDLVIIINALFVLALVITICQCMGSHKLHEIACDVAMLFVVVLYMGKIAVAEGGIHGRNNDRCMSIMTGGGDQDWVAVTSRRQERLEEEEEEGGGGHGGRQRRDDCGEGDLYLSLALAFLITIVIVVVVVVAFVFIKQGRGAFLVIDEDHGIDAVLVVWDACAATRCDKEMGKRTMCGK
jgi:hypothetical protein